MPNRSAGVTLLELLVVISIVAMLTVGVTRAWIGGIDAEQRIRTSREESDRTRLFEDRLRNLLKHAFLSQDPNDAQTYFIGADVMNQETSADATNTITFTVSGTRVPATMMESQDDFETLNQRFGPQGGVGEVTLGMSPIGQAPVQGGLFIREQRPSDGDPSQGGWERVFSDEVDEIAFEFFDGTQWVPSWDTRIGQRRLPAAIRVSYQLANDETERVFTVKLPLSDVTPLNPLTVEGDA